jgi:hypothetical protein
MKFGGRLFGKSDLIFTHYGRYHMLSDLIFTHYGHYHIFVSAST